jgi:hypothetical protein
MDGQHHHSQNRLGLPTGLNRARARAGATPRRGLASSRARTSWCATPGTCGIGRLARGCGPAGSWLVPRWIVIGPHSLVLVVTRQGAASRRKVPGHVTALAQPAALGRSDVSVRQLAHRAREHVQARRPRFEVDRGQQREVTQRFLDAAVGGDIDRLMAVLAPEVILTSDGGGLARAARRPITGAGKVARFLAAISSRPHQGIDISAMMIEMAEINGGPGVLMTFGGRVLLAATWLVADGRVTAIQLVTNPDKLGTISAGRTLPL